MQALRNCHTVLMADPIARHVNVSHMQLQLLKLVVELRMVETEDRSHNIGYAALKCLGQGTTVDACHRELCKIR